MNSIAKTCQNCRQDFTVDPEDFAFYEKMRVPPPTFCPNCRLQRRLTFRNERSLYKRPCDLCKKDTFSIYPADSALVVYCPQCWQSDKWDGRDYARDYDFSRPFFEQFKELVNAVPRPSRFCFWDTLTNSEYTNLVSYCKNCCLLFNSDYNENCSYGVEVEGSRDSFNNLAINTCEMVGGCVNCQKCQRVFYSTDCEGCHNVWFSKNLSGCTDCFGCINLRNKSNYIFNEKYSREDYEKKIREFRTGSYAAFQDLWKKAKNLWIAHPLRYMHGQFNMNVSGDYIYHSKEVRDSYIANEAWNCRYCLWLLAKPTRDAWDYSEWGAGVERIYECWTVGDGASDMKFCIQSGRSSMRCEYSQGVFGSQDLFGCVGMKKKKFCIFNKEYAENEYHALRGKVIAHMDQMPYTDKNGAQYRYGEFFPAELSPFAYNETSAQEFFPLNKTQARERGFSWKSNTTKNHAIDFTHGDLPDLIGDVPDDVAGKNIGCLHEEKCAEQCSGAFRITFDELNFYKAMNIPFPRLCPNCRHYECLAERTPLGTVRRICQCAGHESQNGVYKNGVSHAHGDVPCGAEFETPYRPDSPEIVYCEECYQQEVA